MNKNSTIKPICLLLIAAVLSACGGASSNGPLVLGADDVNQPSDIVDELDSENASTAESSEPESEPEPEPDTQPESDPQPEPEPQPEDATPVSGNTLSSVANPNLCITIVDSSFSNQFSTVDLQACNNLSTQKWTLDDSGNIRSSLNIDYCLGLNYLDYYEQPNVSPCGSANQTWQFIAASIVQNDWALDLDRENNALILYAYHGGENQQWNGVEGFDVVEQEGSGGDNGGAENEEQGGGENQEDHEGQESQQGAGQLFPSSPWTFLTFDNMDEYGTQTFPVPAAQNWVNTGLYLEQGQSVSVVASGEWQVAKNTETHGPNGTGNKIQRGCKVGSLVVRVGLYYQDEQLSCVGEQGTFVAPRSGIVFIGGIVSTDLGETYETRAQANGALSVTLISEGLKVPSIKASDAYFYNYDSVSSGWVEIIGEHTILTLPTEIAKEDSTEIEAAIARLDNIYKEQSNLRGKRPYHGQPIRWFADTEEAPGWMLAGNPIRLDPALVFANNNDRITRAAREGNGNWGFAHELGHVFNFAGGDWYYTTFGGLEAWPNIFSVYTQQKLGLPQRNLDCANRKLTYLATGNSSDNISKDVWLSLCFFMELQEKFGWEFYTNFYAEFNAQPGHGWSFLRDRFSRAAGEDVNPIFDEWMLPQ